MNTDIVQAMHMAEEMKREDANQMRRESDYEWGYDHLQPCDGEITGKGERYDSANMA